MSRSLSSPSNAADVVGITFLIIGLMFVAVGVGFAWFSCSLLTVAHHVKGTVIRNVPNQAQGNDRGSVRTVVEFRLGDERHEFRSWLSTSPSQFDVGDKVTVLYDPRDPQRARIQSFVTLWLFPSVFGGIGAVMLLVAVVRFRALGIFKSKSSTSMIPPGSDSGNFLDERTET